MGRIWIVFVLAVVFLSGAWILWAVYSVQIAHWALGSVFIPAQAGPWGDSFGPFSAFFSALGFAGVAVTLVIQGRALKQQQIDLHKQRFEATFFELLDMLRDARAEVRYMTSADYHRRPSSKNETRRSEVGHAALAVAMKELNFWISKARDAGTLEIEKRYIGNLYREKIYKRYESTLGPYFRIVYNILWRLRADKVLSSEEKRLYANLIRGHLTSFELGLVAFNSQMSQARDLDVLLADFRFLKYYPEGSIRSLLKRLFPNRAFQGRELIEEDEDLLAKDPLESASNM